MLSSAFLVLPMTDVFSTFVVSRNTLPVRCSPVTVPQLHTHAPAMHRHTGVFPP